MNRSVFALAVTLVLGIADVSQAQYGCGFGTQSGAGSYHALVARLIPPTPIVAPPPSLSPPPATEKQAAPLAAVPSAPTTPPPSTTSADRGPSRVMRRQTALN